MLSASWYSLGISCAIAPVPANTMSNAKQIFAFINSFPSACLGESLHGLHVDDLHAAFLDQRAIDGHRVGHLVRKQVLAGLVLLESHHDVDVAFLIENPDGVAGLRAHCGAVFVICSVVAALQVTPQVNHLALDRYFFALRRAS